MNENKTTTEKIFIFLWMQIMTHFNIIGIMSGTSLDGVDIAFCELFFETGKLSKTKSDFGGWKFEIREAETIEYSSEINFLLTTLGTADAQRFAETHAEYGKFLGDLVKVFVAKHNLKIDFVASHGHTIFHQPHNGFTTQIGDGAAISAACGLPVVCDFRSKDVALGGQGAPLVPIGDKLFFGEYDYCLNLGGIANISFEQEGERIAFDVCPANMILNSLAAELNLSFDDGGKIAAAGTLNTELLQQLNEISFYKKTFPKSLGREDAEKDFLPLIRSYEISTEDKLRTVCEHIAVQVENVIRYTLNDNRLEDLKMLTTGGGVYNRFLMERIKELSKTKVVIPSDKIIQYKEALIFALLGALRWRGEVNCLKSVTGASRDSVGGAIYL